MKKVISLIMIVMFVYVCVPYNGQSIRMEVSQAKNLPYDLTEKNDSFQKESQLLEKCGTITILRTKESRKSLTFGAQSQSSSFFARPTDPNGGIDGNQHILPQLYNTTNFVIHWTNGNDTGSPNDKPMPYDDNNTNGIIDVVENWGVIFEHILTFLNNTKGFPVPPNDTAEPNDPKNRNPDGRYDIFLYEMPGYFGYAQAEQYNSPSYSHIGLSRSLGTLELRQATAAHEFFHAIQFVYDSNEKPWWMETTATYMEDEVYPDVNGNYRHLPEWFSRCDISGLESTEINYEYGNFIWAKRLSEDFGDEIIKEIWDEMVSTNGLTAINNTLVSRNSTLKSEFSEFITANFFLEDMYVDGTDYRTAINKTKFHGVYLKFQYNASTASDYAEINQSNADKGAWMDKWATNYITMKLDPTRPNYTIMFDGLDLTTNYLVKLATKKNGNITETIFNLNGAKDGYMNLAYDVFDNITLIMANAGNTATLNPSWRVTITMPPKPPLPIYDVATTDLKSSTDYAHPGETINISVTAENKGTERYEDFNVSTYWGDHLIETQSLIDLPPGNKTTLNITWIIPDGLIGNKTILAEATFVANESNTANNRLENGMLKIVEAVHDVAITDLKSSTNYTHPGETINISVTVKNNGTQRNENFNVSTYWGQFQIETEQVTELAPATTKTLNITWTIPSDLNGSEIIWANATLVSDDANPENNRLENGMLKIVEAVHDVAIKTANFPKNIICQGRSGNITVIAKNNGTFPETISITAYLNGTAVGAYMTLILPEMEKEVDLNVTAFPEISLYRNYTIRVEISPVPGEENLEDNVFLGSWVIVTIEGDVVGREGFPDGKCDLRDVGNIARLFGINYPDPQYNANLDLSYDKKIDMKDVAIAARNFGKTYP